MSVYENVVRLFNIIHLPQLVERRPGEITIYFSGKIVSILTYNIPSGYHPCLYWKITMDINVDNESMAFKSEFNGTIYTYPHIRKLV